MKSQPMLVALLLSLLALVACSGPKSGDSEIIKKLDEETPEVIAQSELASLSQEINSIPQYSLTKEDFQALKDEKDLLTEEELKEIEMLTSEGGSNE